MKAWLDIGRIVSSVSAGAEAALTEIGDQIAADARRRAPIRKVFYQRKRRFRPLTAEERQIALARARHYYTHINPNKEKLQRAIVHIMTRASVELPVRGSPNALPRSRGKRVLGFWTRTGFVGRAGAKAIGAGYRAGPEIEKKMTEWAKWEVGRGRSVHYIPMARGRTKVQMGGRLKASIHAEPVRQEGPKDVVTVAASVRYAKFVEFPTIHNAAQPFLRPALLQVKGRAVRIVAEAMRRSLGVRR